MKARIIMIIGFLLTITLGARSQNTIKGNVTDGTEPIIGAVVTVEGTQNATVTDMDGNFTLENVDANKDVLVFSYIGMTSKKETLNGRTDIKVEMKEDMAQLEDVVVIGYGTQKRGNLTGAMASVDGKQLEKVPVSNVGEAIVGRMPGVQVTTQDGSPDSEITVRVRGGGSITQSNEPLILIDGFEGSLNDVPPTDVESIEVLKDAASTAIYGARGANGVVLVTTKKPNEGRVSVNINAYTQTKELSNKLDVLSPYDFVRANWERIRPKGASSGNGFANTFGQPYEFYIYQGYEGYDWQDIIFDTHPISSYVDANISGGNDKAKYKVSLMHQNQPSVMPSNGLKQYNLNAQLNLKLWKFLSVEYHTRYMHKVLNGRGTEGVGLLASLQEQPTNGLQDFTSQPENNELVDDDTFTEYYHYDPLEQNRRFYRKRTTDLLNMGGALIWTIMKGLTLRNEFVYEDYRENDRNFNAANSNSASKTYGPNLTENDAYRTKWQLTNVINYNFSLNDVHDFQLMAGQEMKNEASHSKRNYIGYFPENISAEKAFDNYALGTPISNTSSRPSPMRISSFFGRINYSFNDRYLATVTLRTDGSSKFAKNNRWGWFPAMALAWRMNNEAFLKNVQWLSNLKLRLSLGTSGNDRISSDLFLKMYKLGDRNKSAGWGEQGSYFYEFQNKYPVNPDVKWETTVTRNLGIDFGFWGGRLNGGLDVYWNTTKDLLLETQIPGDTGFTSLMTNVGQTSNRGIELNLNAYIVEKKDWTLSANFNIGFNKGKIDKLAGNEEAFYATAGVNINDDVFWYRVGEKMGTIYGYVNDGFYTVNDFNYDANANTYTLKEGIVDCSLLVGNLTPGSAKFKKLTDDPNDANRYILTQDDRKIIGETTPKLSGGFGLNATWKNLDLSAFFNYMCGFDVINMNKINMSLVPSNSGLYRNLSGEFKNMWYRYDAMGNDMYSTPEIWAKYNEKATIWNPSGMTKSFISTYGIEDGSFLRLNTLTLGYSLPKAWLKPVGMTKCRFYVTGYNLFTLTSYSGYDPEVNIGRGISPNIDNNMYPRSRSYTIGVQVGF